MFLQQAGSPLIHAKQTVTFKWYGARRGDFDIRYMERRLRRESFVFKPASNMQEHWSTTFINEHKLW